ncbi:MAG: UDP-N-acetylmuramoyl-tripeptide--D-alanyl-D-alanine ligase [Verrucomicrobiaceae bacterium]|nr:UDP-N-acetylmuramoyl-tripeptide--D-alanyl-D-alanine ligase [Verrucomicrobiaceae bacterium]
MKHLTLASVADYSGGCLRTGRPEDKINSVSIDSRTIREGALFIALRGENFDGHDFVGKAIDSGASAVMLSKEGYTANTGECAVVGVEDTYAALQLFARNYRMHLGLTVIGITGSNGKTTTKDLIASVLSEEFSVSATAGNLNNHIGLPLSILSADDSHEFGVWEMGMSMPGEIKRLSEIAAPDVAVVTNVGMAHIESMHSREAIAREKGMLAEGVGEEGIVILNGEDEYADAIAGRCCARVVRVGFGVGDFRAVEVQQAHEGMEFTIVVNGEKHRAAVASPGRHMIINALLASAVGSHLGLSMEVITRGLGRARITAGRMQSKCIGGVSYIDDSYNANPDSMSAAINTLAGQKCEGRRILVIGAMAELGDISESEHLKVGKAAIEADIDCILSVGEMAAPVHAGAESQLAGRAKHFGEHGQCVDFLRREARPGDLVLVKGSRSSAMERILEGLV